jgi:hypothetical protein
VIGPFGPGNTAPRRGGLYKFRPSPSARSVLKVWCNSSRATPINTRIATTTMRPDITTTIRESAGRQASPITSHTYTGVATYRGINLGWVPVGRPRSKAATERLLALVNKVRPDYTNKIITTLPL